MKLSVKFGALGIELFVRSLRSTLDYKLAHYDPSNDPVQPEFKGRCIFVFWHEYLFFPMVVYGPYKCTTLISRHRDGDWGARAAQHMRLGTVRGSTTRGSAAALRELKRQSKDRHICITPDGPKGPRRTLAAGAVYLASRLQLPLVPAAFGYDRPLRMPSWDRFAVPRPFSRVRGIFGPRLEVPEHADRGQLEVYRQRAEDILNRLTLEAEAWAEAGTRKINERPIPQARHTRFRRVDTAVTDLHAPYVSQELLKQHTSADRYHE